MTMADMQEKLAESLTELHSLQKDKGLVAIKSDELSRTHRERLTKNGFLKEVAKGWYIAADPTENQAKRHLGTPLIGNFVHAI